MSENMNYEQKNDEDIKDILTEDKNIDVQVREYNTYDVPLGILYGIAIYSFTFLIIGVGILKDIAILFFIPLFIMFVVVLILQIRNIMSAKREGNIDYCLNTYFLYKYIAMPIELICAGMVGVTISTLFGLIIQSFEERLLVIAVFLFVAFILAIVPYIAVTAAIIELPCLISVDCIIGITRKEYGMSFIERTIHFFLQMIPIVGIADGLYISIKYWNRGKLLARVTAICVVIFIVVGIVIDLILRFK